MFTKTDSNKSRALVHKRIRRRVTGTAERPRLAVFRSVSHIYVQVIDDVKGVTLVSASSNEGAEKGGTAGKGGRGRGGNVATAKEIGKKVAERAKEAGIGHVVFDRGGYIYHGRIKALADAAREAGLEF